ncbi:MAG TPA: class I SAM-dependent methyltransferase [Candidatus Paceibacterota bacterium]
MAFSLPQQIIQALSLREGMYVADFGAGSGHYTLAAARKVNDGKVCAVDIQKNLLSRIKNEASREGLSNVDVVWGDIDEVGGSRLAPHSMDVVILANVLFQIERRGMLVEEVKRVLKPKGRVLLIDWQESFGGVGPEERDVLRKNDAQELFLTAGFTLERDISTIAGDHHYGFVFSMV